MRCRDERGAVAVEFALVLPILVMLLFGIITGGLAYSQSIGLANATREGARFGATAPNGPNWSTDVLNRTRELQLDDDGSTAICVDLVDSSGTAKASGCDAGSVALGPADAPPVTVTLAANECVVRVWSARPWTLNTGVFKQDNVMRQQSITRFEREC